MIKEVDEDGDGEIDYEEFVRMMSNVTKQMERREGDDLRAAFKVGVSIMIFTSVLRRKIY